MHVEWHLNHVISYQKITEAIQLIPAYDAPPSPALGYVPCWQPTLELIVPWTSDWTECQPRHHGHP